MARNQREIMLAWVPRPILVDYNVVELERASGVLAQPGIGNL
jgi:hypothetical protein